MQIGTHSLLAYQQDFGGLAVPADSAVAEPSVTGRRVANWRLGLTEKLLVLLPQALTVIACKLHVVMVSQPDDCC